ncbi:serine/threonine-protein kinase PAK mbt-like [Sycon ciliatum]|uniref:serine/threonine-protein kinase PAK mbt-like n=1 Tax=Sycon ciliatum TaxID=27933 RepID=UPI0031F6876C
MDRCAVFCRAARRLVRSLFNRQRPSQFPEDLFQVAEFDAARNTWDGEIELHDKIVGRGAYGTVVVCSIPGMHKAAVAKTVMVTDATRHRIIVNEAIMMRELKHPNINALFGALQCQDRVVYILERVDGVTFSQICRGRQERQRLPLLGEKELRDLMHQLLLALRYLEALGIVHSDIKSNNVMMAAGGQVKLIDFGCAVDMYDPNRIGIRPRARADPPETRDIILGGICPKTDIFMLATMLYQMFLGCEPFGKLRSLTPASLLDLLSGGPKKDSVFASMSLELQDLFIRMMTYLPQERIGAQQALEHRWFRAQPDSPCYPVPPLRVPTACPSPESEDDLDAAAIDDLQARFQAPRANIVEIILRKPNGWLGIAYRANTYQLR